MTTTILESPRPEPILAESPNVEAPQQSTRARFRTGMFFNLLGAVFNQGSTFAVNLVLARSFGRAVFGEYAIVLSTITSLALLAQFGIPYTVTKYISEHRSSDRDRASRIFSMLTVFSFALAAISAVALLIAARWLATSVMKSDALAFPYAISAIVLFFTVLNGFAIAALSGLERYKTLASALTSSGAGYFLICVGLGWRFGLNGAVIGLMLSAIFQFVLLARALRADCARQGIHLCFRGLSSEQDVVLKFALPAGLAGLSSSIGLWLPSVFLVRQAGGYSQMALYGVAFSMMSMILFLPGIANTVGSSLINHHMGMGKTRAYERTFWGNLLVTTGLVLSGSACLALIGPWVLRFFGRDFKDGYPVLLVLLVAVIPQGLSLATNQIIQSRSRMWASLVRIAVPRDVLVIVLAIRLAPIYGARGLAVSYAISWIVAFAVTVVLVSRIGIAPATAGRVLAEAKT